MTKPGAENEDLRPHLVTKTSLYNKARVTLAELPDGDSHLPSLGLLSSMARFVNWFGLTLAAVGFVGTYAWGLG